jgi:hypothetical protein
MNLIELIAIVEENRIETISLPENVELDFTDVYIKESLDAKKELVFLNADDPSNKLEMKIEGLIYLNLFPLSMLIDMIQSYLDEKIYSNLEIAIKILSYREMDA